MSGAKATDLARLNARLAFPQSQLALAPMGGGGATVLLDARVGWHGSLLAPETGAFCLVCQEGRLAGRIGELLEVGQPGRSVIVLVDGSVGLPGDLSLSRRAFLALGPLAVDELVVRVASAL